MNIPEIIRADIEKNYQGRGFDIGKVISNFEIYRRTGGVHFSTGKVIITLKYIGDDTIEFHCMNGGSGKDLTEAVALMAKKLSDKYDFAVTYYDNPKVSDLAKYVQFASTIEKIDDGEDRTYSMTFDLRSQDGRSQQHNE